MNTLQLRYPEIVHSGPKHKFCIFLRAEGWRNALKHSQTSFWVQWSRMDALQLRYLEIVHSGPKHKFCIFYVPKVSEMLWNNPKHHFGSNGVERMLYNFGTRNSAFRPKTQVLHLLRAEGYRNALKHSQTSFWVQWSGMDALQLRYPEIVHSGPKRKFCIFYVLKVSEMLWNTLKHHFGSNGVEWMLNNFGTPK
jgi:glycopeptide antibiotics resistance protein